MYNQNKTCKIMNNNFKKFPGQNFGQNTTVATENVAAETVTPNVAEVANNKSAFAKIATSKVTMYTVAGLAVAGLGWYGYKRIFGGKKAAEKTTTTADPEFEEAK